MGDDQERREKLSDRGLVSSKPHPMKQRMEEELAQMRASGRDAARSSLVHMMSRMGVQRLYKFANGYGASVVNGELVTMVNDPAFFELAVLGPDGSIVYDTPVTPDVERGYAGRMNDLLKQIEELPPRKLPSVEELDGMDFDA